ncbi:MAG: hypothetical protein WDN04_10470 [Rhodospirillales bacterium]
MIDDAVILFTTIMCLVVVFRAIRLDGRMPWFGDGPRRAGTEGPPRETPDRGA